MSSFFAMGGYANFVWPAYAISFLVLAGATWLSLHRACAPAQKRGGAGSGWRTTRISANETLSLSSRPCSFSWRWAGVFYMGLNAAPAGILCPRP